MWRGPIYQQSSPPIIGYLPIFRILLALIFDGLYIH